jgi:hypothetical protein
MGDTIPVRKIVPDVAVVVPAEVARKPQIYVHLLTLPTRVADTLAFTAEVEAVSGIALGAVGAGN